MKYLKLYESFSHQMILLNNENLYKNIPQNLTIIHNDRKVEYDRGDIVPSDSQIQIFFIKKDEKDIIYKGVAPEKLILKLYAKNENKDIMRYMETEQVLFLELTDGNSPVLNMKLSKSNVDHIIPQLIKLEKSTKDKILKLINSFKFDIKIKSKDL